MTKQTVERTRVSPLVIRRRLVDKEVVAVSPVFKKVDYTVVRSRMREQLRQWQERTNLRV